MKHFIKIMILSVLITYPEWAVAENSNFIHTHTPIELEFVSSNSAPEFKLAGVCFLGQGDCGEGGFTKGDDDMDINPSDQCKNEGFTATCTAGQKLKKDPRCQWDENYGICCKETCPTNAATNCTGESVGDDGCGYTCKKCCNNSCPVGYDLNNGDCKQSSTIKTTCGDVCYKILNNTCSTGNLTPPAESGGNRNKIVSKTECGNSCWQSFGDNCPAGYVKEKANGKCYETSVSYTPYGSPCFKERPCCDDSCGGYGTVPSTSQCKYGYDTSTTGCGNKCYTCKPCQPTCNNSDNGSSESRCCKNVMSDNGCGSPCTQCDRGFHCRTWSVAQGFEKTNFYGPDMYIYDGASWCGVMYGSAFTVRTGAENFNRRYTIRVQRHDGSWTEYNGKIDYTIMGSTNEKVYRTQSIQFWEPNACFNSVTLAVEVKWD